MTLAFHHMGFGINIRHPGVGKQAQIELFGKFTRRLADKVVGTLPLTDHMAEIRFVVLIDAIGGNQG